MATEITITQENGKYRSAWIDVARAIACYLIVCVHTPNCPDWIYSWSLGGRNALFFMLAGYFCRFDLSYRKMCHKVLWLLIPFLIWNLIAVYSGYGVSDEISVKSLTGLGEGNLFPSDSPLWFLFYIILFTLFVPFFRLLLRYKWIVLAILIIFSGTGNSVFHNDNMIQFINGVVPFYIGLCFSNYKLCEIEKSFIVHKRYILIILLSLAMCFIPNFRFGYMLSLFGMLSIISVSALIDKRFGSLSRFLSRNIAPASFLIFATHVLIISFFRQNTNLGDSKIWGILFPFGVVTCVSIVYIVLDRYIPWILVILAHKQPKLKNKGLPPTKRMDIILGISCVCIVFFFINYLPLSLSCKPYDVSEKNPPNTICINSDMIENVSISNGVFSREFCIRAFENSETKIQFSFQSNRDCVVHVFYKNFGINEVYDGLKFLSYVYKYDGGAKTCTMAIPNLGGALINIRLDIMFQGENPKVVFLDTENIDSLSDRVFKGYSYVKEIPGNKFRNINLREDGVSGLTMISGNGSDAMFKSLSSDPIINFDHSVRTNALGIARVAIDYTSSQETDSELYYAENGCFTEQQKIFFPCHSGRSCVVLTIIGKPDTDYDIRFDPATKSDVVTTIHSVRELLQETES